MIKSLLVLLFSLTTVSSLFAAPGTTFCPHPQDFKYDAASGSMVAPGGWTIMLGSTVEVAAFVKADATEGDGQISSCSYNINFQGVHMQFPATADNYRYVADNIKSSVWHKGANDMVCVSTTPETCTFHLQQHIA